MSEDGSQTRAFQALWAENGKVYFCTRAYNVIKLPVTEEFAAKKGAILITGGGLALQPYIDYLPLSMDKAALRAMVQTLASSLKERGIVAFSPMANGFLSGKFSAKDTFQKNDLRTVITHFNKENMEANEPLLELVRNFASDKNCTPAQIGLAWVLAYGDFVVPIPGMRKEERIIENLGAADIEF